MCALMNAKKSGAREKKKMKKRTIRRNYNNTTKTKIKNIFNSKNKETIIERLRDR